MDRLERQRTEQIKETLTQVKAMRAELAELNERFSGFAKRMSNKVSKPKVSTKVEVSEAKVEKK